MCFNLWTVFPYEIWNQEALIKSTVILGLCGTHAHTDHLAIADVVILSMSASATSYVGILYLPAYMSY